MGRVRLGWSQCVTDFSRCPGRTTTVEMANARDGDVTFTSNPTLGMRPSGRSPNALDDAVFNMALIAGDVRSSNLATQYLGLRRGAFSRPMASGEGLKPAVGLRRRTPTSPHAYNRYSPVCVCSSRVLQLVRNWRLVRQSNTTIG